VDTGSRLEELQIAMPTLNVNVKSVTVDVPADTPLLWTLGDELGLTGTTFGWGMALCNDFQVGRMNVASRATHVHIVDIFTSQIRSTP
jgi:aerobic-type carbon monoxide dehydrogenase small subunit (CoxS/CutS family)